MRDRYDHVYLSPHLDDAVLSCGGRIWQQVQAGHRVVVVTVFAGAPEPGVSLSSYAEDLHVRWGSLDDAVHERQREDLKALDLLGVEGVRWRYADCIYRTTPDGDCIYAAEGALWGEIDPSEVDMIERLVEQMRALPLTSGGTLYGPLGIGGHVDHRITRRSAEASGHSLTYYEDFPYASDSRLLRDALREGQWEAELVTLAQAALKAKIDAIACYRSQVSTFWDGPDKVAASVRTFAERTGGEEPAERYWRASLP